MTQRPLSAVPFFQGLSQREQDVIKQHMVRRRLEKNTLILSEGERTDALYMIERGAVKAFLSDEDGKEIILSVHRTGGYFGEIALLDSAPRSASVMTIEPTELLVISRDRFKACFASNPDVALAVICELTARIRLLIEKVRGFAFFDVYGRVVRVLTYLPRGANGVVAENLTQLDISNMVGASREMVNRVLKDLESNGYIAVKHRHIEILRTLPNEFADCAKTSLERPASAATQPMPLRPS